jgi:hypothetical protein
MPTCPVKRDEKEYKMSAGAIIFYTVRVFSCRRIIREVPVLESGYNKVLRNRQGSEVHPSFWEKIPVTSSVKPCRLVITDISNSIMIFLELQIMSMNAVGSLDTSITTHMSQTARRRGQENVNTSC